LIARECRQGHQGEYGIIACGDAGEIKPASCKAGRVIKYRGAGCKVAIAIGVDHEPEIIGVADDACSSNTSQVDATSDRSQVAGVLDFPLTAQPAGGCGGGRGEVRGGLAEGAVVIPHYEEFSVVQVGGIR